MIVQIDIVGLYLKNVFVFAGYIPLKQFYMIVGGMIQKEKRKIWRLTGR